MPNPSSSRPHRPRDLSLLAHAIVDEATAEREPAAPSPAEPATAAPAPTPDDDGKNPAAVALGRLGGLKGGKARAAKLTAEERSAIAKRAAAARWAAQH